MPHAHISANITENSITISTLHAHSSSCDANMRVQKSEADLEHTPILETSIEHKPLCDMQGTSKNNVHYRTTIYSPTKTPQRSMNIEQDPYHNKQERMEIGFRLPLKIMRYLGFVWAPHIFGSEPIFYQILSIIWSLFLFLINFGVMCLVMSGVHHSRMETAMLHPGTMSDLLTGLKPLRNSVNLLMFITMQAAHTQLIRSMQKLDQDFFESFGVHPNWRKGTRTFCLCVFVAFLIPFLSRVTELGLLLRFMPISEMPFDLDQSLRSHNSDFYYRNFMQITNCVKALNDSFHMYLFFAVGLSVMILCLFIYFVINAPKVLAPQPNMGGAEMVLQYFLPAWAGIQVLVAAAHVVCIAIAGLKVNEAARSMGGVVLNLHCGNEQDRFNVIRFMHRVQSQHPAWGVSIWRALPVERSLLFTIFGMISTYAVLLLKLQKDHQRDDIVAACSIIPTVMSKFAAENSTLVKGVIQTAQQEYENRVL